MNYLQSKQNTLLTTDVCEMMGKSHTDVMYMINGNEKRRIVGIRPVIEMNAELHLSDYFIESTYIDSANRKRPCYECTKLGCELLANKLTGEKGILFTAKYVKKFNLMEQGTQNIQNIEALVMSCVEKVVPMIVGSVMEKLTPMLNPPVQEKQIDQERKNKFIKYISDNFGDYPVIFTSKMAQLYGKDTTKFNDLLCEKGFQVKAGKVYEEIGNNGYKKISYSFGYPVSDFTSSGAIAVFDLLAKDDIYPIIK